MKPNVLLVVLDSVRARNTSLHGYARETTPTLEALAAESTVYEQMRAPGITSLPSHTSMFTGYAVAEHDVHDTVLHSMETGVTFWSDLRTERGYETGVFSRNPNLVSDTGLRDEFGYVYPGSLGPSTGGRLPSEFKSEYGTDFESPREKYASFLRFAAGGEAPVRTLLNGLTIKLSHKVTEPWVEHRMRNSAQYVEDFLEWSDGRDRWAACINLLDAHHPYYPRPDADRWGGRGVQRTQSALNNPSPWEVHGGEVSLEQWASFEDLYDGAIRQVDRLVGELVDALERRGEFDETLLVITSDHGEGFGEPSRIRRNVDVVGHTVGLHERLLHVPCLVSYPGQKEGETVDEVATLTRLPAAVEAAVEGDWTGTEFVPDGRVYASGTEVGQKEGYINQATAYLDDVSDYEGSPRAVYSADGRTKYATWGEDAVAIRFDDGGADVERDSDEARREVAAVFDSLEDAEIRVDRTADDVDQSTKDRLADLGYV